VYVTDDIIDVFLVYDDFRVSRFNENRLQFLQWGVVLNGFYLGTWYEIARFDHSFERGVEEAKVVDTLNKVKIPLFDFN
jgi:hypothetical protein